MNFRRFSAAAALIAVAAVPAHLGAQPAVATPFTLAEALALARGRSPEGAAVRARAEAARQAVDYAGSWPNPVFELRTENLLSGVPRSVLPLDTFAEVTQVIELGGKRAARRGLADAAAGVTAAESAMADARLALDVSREYLDALRLRERHRTLAAHVADLDEAVRVLDRRVAAGTAAESELLRLRTEAARADVERVRAELAATRALVILTARLAIETTLDALVAPAPPALPRTDESAVERRPDVAVARRAVESARQGLRLEEARAVSDPAVNAGYKRTAGYDTALVTFTVPLPLFYRNAQGRTLAAGQLTASELELAAVERRAHGDIAATRTAAETLADRARDVRQRLVAPALGARDAARASFSTGLLDVLRLVDVERVYADARLAAIDLEIDAVVAAIEARLAAGEDPLP